MSKSPFCDFQNIDSQVVRRKPVWLVEDRELSMHGFLSPLPALFPPSLSIIKCYQSGYKISVEQSALLGLLSWWVIFLKLKRGHMFLGKQSIACRDEASLCRTRGGSPLLPKPPLQLHPLGLLLLEPSSLL